MKAPLSWLKEYVDTKLDPKTLGERLTEVGLGVEKIEKVDGDTIFELEITPNRPDCLSIVGIAREIAAIENKKIKLPDASLSLPSKTTLPIKLKPDYKLFYRWTGITITNITIKESPAWMQERLKKVGLRPINNLVDITNYVMFELGIPLHAFDYDEIKGGYMVVEEAKGEEKFTTVDEQTYFLPKDAIIIRDQERVIDLAGIKGGLNSGITSKTKNVFIHMTIDDPVHIRKTSQTLSLRSDASAIYERGPDRGGTVEALKRAASLVLQLAGGKLASDIIDLKKENFEPWEVILTHQHLTKMLGIDLDTKKVVGLLERLNLKVKMNKNTYTITVPTYRNDLKIPEDIIEEVARLYGYNNFPKTMPIGEIPTRQIPYYKNYLLDQKIKHILTASGFSEVYTYSLVSEDDLTSCGINADYAIRVDNPVSKEFEYLRPSILMNLIKAALQNRAYTGSVNLFELGKVYVGKAIDKVEEYYVLSGIATEKSFFEVKGLLERLFNDLGIVKDPTPFIRIIDEGIFFEIPIKDILKETHMKKIFQPIPKYPSITEDLAIIAHASKKTGDIIEEIKKQSSLIVIVDLLDQFQDTRTFHIVYQHQERNLTSSDVVPIREKITKTIKEKFAAKIKD